MNYAKQLRAYEDRLENIGEDRENLAYVFKELKQWTSLDFLLHQNQEVTSEDQALLERIF